MELVAASKMRKAQDLMAASRPYADKIRQVIRHVAQSSSEYHHPYLTARNDSGRIGFIVVTSDRGLCGGLNINLFRTLMRTMQEHQQQGRQHDLCLIGKKRQIIFQTAWRRRTRSRRKFRRPPLRSRLGWRSKSHAGPI